MSTFEIKMPKLGESITEGTIMVWNIKPGDTIKEDDILLEVNTAKVSAEIPSPVAGKIIKLLFNEGDVVPVGETIAIVQLDGEDGPVETPESTSTDVAPAKETQDTEKPAETPVSQPVSSSKKEETAWYSPVVLRLSQEAKISMDELGSIPGTGYLGRLSKKDIERYIEQKKKGTATAAPTPTPESKPHVESIKSVTEPASKPQVSAPVIPSAGGDQVKEMDYVRRLIADHMVLSKKVSPHVTTVIEVDMTKLVHWRNKVKDEFLRREGVKLTFMPSIVEATAKALADFPQVNASVDGYNMILKKNINVGVAVSLNDGNLIVPVIHNADKMNINGLAVSIDTLANKARSNKLSPDDIQGGTFTITNFGTFKNIIGTPIINQPQVAILGVGYVEKKPAVIETPEGDVIAIRHKMYLSLSYDHRIINGALGGEFLRRIGDYLEAGKE